jgi:hypothetical protein
MPRIRFSANEPLHPLLHELHDLLHASGGNRNGLSRSKLVHGRDARAQPAVRFRLDPDT